MDDHPNPERRWKNMRRMAYIALICAVVETIALLILLAVGAVKADMFSASAGWIGVSYLLWGGIIGSYMGVSGTADAWGFKK